MGLKSKKTEKARYYLEVAENCRHKAQTAEKRVEKAMEVGADDPKHKHHKLFKKLMDEAETYWKYHEEYLRQYTDEIGETEPEIVKEAKKIFEIEDDEATE